MILNRRIRRRGFMALAATLAAFAALGAKQYATAASTPQGCSATP
jgi:hypothetical protein